MSTLQYVILLLVIFFTCNGPVNVIGYARKVRMWLLTRRVRQVHEALLLHGVLFRNNAFKDFTGFCMNEDFISQRDPNSTSSTRVRPTFIFRIRDPKKQDKLNDEALAIVGGFLYRLCDERIPRKYFVKKYLNLNLIMKNERDLLIPQDAVTEYESLEALDRRLSKYLHDRGK